MSLPDSSLQHLLAELARIDARIRRQVDLWQRAGQDAGDAFRGLYISDAQADALLARPLAAHWGDLAAPDPAEAQAWALAESESAARAAALAEAARSRGQAPRLELLAQAFGLSRFEVDALLICLAPALDLRYERLYGYLQDDVTRKRPSVSLILDLLTPPGPERLLAQAYFDEGASLFRFRLLERAGDAGQAGLLGQPLRIDETVAAWLLGRYAPRQELAGAQLLSPAEPPAGCLLAPDVRAALSEAAGEEAVLLFHGPDRAGQMAAAQAVAVRCRRPLLSIDLGLATAELSPLAAVRLALRDARLTGAVACLIGWDACLERGATPATLLAEVLGQPGPIILAGQAPWQPAGVERSRPFLAVEFAVPGYARRRELWRHFLGEAVPPAEVDALAGRFLLTGDQIRDAVATARDRARQRGESVQSADLFAAARAHSGSGLASLARKITPHYGWGDIILPADQIALLREIIAAVRSRPRVLDEWGVGDKLVPNSGVTMLFAGPPGTGKTMAAEIIATELGLDLYKIDLSAVVSKYIGETEKNLERVFAEAASSNAILFFDEADALFGRRSEVRDSHDRYANIEISYLLQRMEAYEGVTILATNLRANLDEAFTRRLQFVVDFPFPEEADRLRIWQALFPPQVPRAAGLDLALLARRFKLAGGNIRNVIVSAAYLAAADGQAVTMEHLLHATRRELQKMGRLVGEEDWASA